MNREALPKARRVFDAHVHVERGMSAYDLASASKNVIFNEVGSYRTHANAYRSAGNAITLIVDTGPDIDFVCAEARAERIDALKIHSRISRLRVADWEVVAERLRLLPPQLPIVIDAFYYGAELEYQPSLAGIIGLLRQFPERRFITAHSGGYRLLEYFFHLREFKNCYYELALTLQYFEDASVLQDVRKLVRFTDKDRILFGSDFPFGSPARQLVIAIDICSGLALSEQETDQILYGNAARLFGKNGSNG